MKRQNKSYYERLIAMTPAQRDAEVAQFDHEDLRPGRPLTAADRARHARARRKAGRPRVGQGVQVISLSIEQGLLHRADALARRQGLSRAALVARGLQAVLAASGAA